MAFELDAKLSDVLTGGYHLSTQLQALLGRPLDSRGQEMARGFSQELSRVFMVSMSMLNCNVVAPEITMGNSSGVSTPAKDQRARGDSGEVVTPSKKSREEKVTGKEITSSPHKDGYRWRKYGQKKIQNCNFSRYYYKCNRHRRCEAKKKVQQQDGSRGQLPPVFEVTYLNQHTCHELRASDDDAACRMASSSPGTRGRRHAAGVVVDIARSDAGDQLLSDHLFPHHIAGGGADDEEKRAIVSCLATVVSGAVPPPPSPSLWWPPAPEASAAAAAGDPAAFVPDMAADDGAAMMMVVDTGGFSWDPSPFCPGEEAGHDQLMMMTTNSHLDMHMDDDVAGLADTVWPRHSCGAWR